jgi:kynurenine 3-monooxygenase
VIGSAVMLHGAHTHTLVKLSPSSRAHTYPPCADQFPRPVNTWQVSRENLNNMLLDQAEALDGVTLHFGTKLTHISPDGMLHFVDSTSPTTSRPATYNDYTQGDILLNPRLTIGADGAYSATRESMLRLLPMNFRREYIGHGYKELTIPPDPVTGKFAMSVPEALHIWPRGEVATTLPLRTRHES